MQPLLSPFLNLIITPLPTIHHQLLGTFSFLFRHSRFSQCSGLQYTFWIECLPDFKYGPCRSHGVTCSIQSLTCCLSCFFPIPSQGEIKISIIHIASLSYASTEVYLWETSPVVTVEEVDITFFPAISTASQILPDIKRFFLFRAGSENLMMQFFLPRAQDHSCEKFNNELIIRARSKTMQSMCKDQLLVTKLNIWLKYHLSLMIRLPNNNSRILKGEPTYMRQQQFQRTHTYYIHQQQNM